MNPTVDLLLHSSHTFICNLLSGMQPIYFEWFIDGQKQSSMNINSSIQIESKPNFSLLTIRNLTLASAGIYQCNARNVYGIDSTRIQLRVKGSIDSFLLTGLDSKMFLIWISLLESMVKCGAIVATSFFLKFVVPK